MSADIGVFHSSEIDDPALLPAEGWYIGAFRGERCEEATGPYPSQESACVGMMAKPFGHWLAPASRLPAGIRRFDLEQS